MKKLLISLYLLVVITFSIYEQIKAEDENNGSLSTDKKIDSIYVIQKEIYKTIKDEPLADKKYGIEVNIFRLLFFFDNNNINNHSFSGGFSLFDIDRNAEIVFPIFYHEPQYSDEEYEEDFDIVRKFSLDCHYRRFLGNTQNGFYISGFIRYANVKGWIDDNEGEKLHTENKFGIGIGIGRRIFSYKGFYWGTSLNLGRYIIGKNDIFGVGILDGSFDSELIITFELLKFGWAF